MPISTSELLETLNWRYATKAFDPQKKISAEDWSALEDSLVLTPSSFGLQPWEFVVVEDAAVRESLVEHSWNQRQVADASHLLVICARTDIDEAWIDRFMARQVEVRGAADTDGNYRGMMAGFVNSLEPAARQQWAKMQTYIALGQFMTATALLGIDACPMEGFLVEKYDEILGLTEKNLTASVLCPAGYRSADDKYADAKKVRFEKSAMVTRG